MRTYIYKRTDLNQRTCTMLVACVFALGMGLYAPVAHAQFAVSVVGGPGTIAGTKNAAVNTMNYNLNQTLANKQLQLDPMAYDMAQRALEKQTQQIIDYNNSGFGGDAAFIQNLESYLKTVRDNAAGKAIKESGAYDNVCKAFRSEVTTDSLQYVQKLNHQTADTISSCTLNDYTNGNTDGFLDNKFSVGGWSAFMEMVVHPEQNTPIGSTLSHRQYVADQMEQAADNAKTRANWSNGWKDVKACGVKSVTPNALDDCQVNTPGVLIQENLKNHVIDAPTQALLNADQYQETVGDLFSQLSSQFLTGINGLLGLSQSGTSGSGSGGSGQSYTSQLALERNDPKYSTVNQTTLKDSLEFTKEKLDYQLQITTAIDGAESDFKDARAPYASSSCWSLVFPPSLTRARDGLLQGIPLTIASSVALQQLVNEYGGTSASSRSKSQVLGDFMSMMQQNLIPDQTDVDELKTQLEDTVQPAINDLDQQLDAQKESCS